MNQRSPGSVFVIVAALLGAAAVALLTYNGLTGRHSTFDVWLVRFLTATAAILASMLYLARRHMDAAPQEPERVRSSVRRRHDSAGEPKEPRRRRLVRASEHSHG